MSQEPYPPWEEVQETISKTLDYVVRGRGFCPRQIDPDDLFQAAFIRLRTYYHRGIVRGNIKKFESWCRVKAWSAARDERRHMLKLRSLEGEVEHVPLEIEREGGDFEELAEVHTSREGYTSSTFNDVEWGMQDTVREVLIEHAKVDPESVAVVLLYDVEEFSAAEIAAQRHKTERQITYTVQKDRKSIEQLLKARNITTLKDVR